MDSSLFDPTSDADRRRFLALELYGVDATFRASDSASASLNDIVMCAVHFTDATDAAIALLPRDGPVQVASHGPRPDVWDPHSTTAGWLVAPDDGTSADFTTQRTGGRGSSGTYCAVKIVGREAIGLGLLLTWQASNNTPPAERVTTLLKQLARAAAAALDEQRRIWERRRGPTLPQRKSPTTERRQAKL